MALPSFFRRGLLGGGLLALVALAAGFGWLARRSDAIPFLPTHRGADWIVFPAPANPAIIPAVLTEGRFRRAFTLPAQPGAAELKFSAFRGARVFLNGTEVSNPAPATTAWKRVRAAAVAPFLRAGTNLLEVSVTNDFGPPALWLRLTTDGTALPTDARWEVSLAGAAWRPAQLATQPPSRGPGNPFAPEPGSDVAGFPTRALLLALGAMLVVAAGIYLAGGKRRRLNLEEPSTFNLQPSTSKEGPNGRHWRLVVECWRLNVFPGPRGFILPAVCALAWAALFWNNLPQLNRLYGFDAEGHKQYIRFIQQRGALPLATDGWQMYQPPLYYAAAALALNVAGLKIEEDAAALWLRVGAAGIGLLHVALLFLALRLVFPASPGRVLVGTLLGALLPAHLCLAHFVTNETLAALFVTATLYFTLRTLRAADDSLTLPVAAGLALGTALLAKFSAVLVTPVLVGALGWSLIERGEFAPRAWLRRVGAPLAAALLVCGWHYARVWRQFGSPLVGNWDAASQFAWWQAPGFRTADYYTGFGPATLQPLFAGLGSLADGLYSTLWSDGLAGSASRMAFRPPWNYEWLVTANALGLVGLALVGVGLVSSARRLWRRPTAENLLFVGLLGVFVAGIAYMTMRVASFAQVKAFYGLPALLPFCVLALLGWDALARRHRLWPALLGGWFCVWLAAVGAAFWVRADNPQTQVAWGIWFNDGGRGEAARRSFERALARDPRNAAAAEGLADLLGRQGRWAEARAVAEAAMAHHPEHGAAHWQLALALHGAGETNLALTHLERAIALAPEHFAARQQLAQWHWQAGRFGAAVAAGREAVAVAPYEPAAQALLGLAWGGAGDLTNALSRLQFAAALKPEWSLVQQKLAALLEALQRPAEALTHFALAATHAPQDVAARLAWAMALERGGQARAALAAYEQARQLQPDRPDILNNVAWLLATANAAEVRDGAAAVRLAAHACALTGEREPQLLGTLAAAYAEAGRFPEAIATAEKARDLAGQLGLADVAGRNGELLELYRAGQPARAAPGGGDVDRK